MCLCYVLPGTYADILYSSIGWHRVTIKDGTVEEVIIINK